MRNSQQAGSLMQILVSLDAADASFPLAYKCDRISQFALHTPFWRILGLATYYCSPHRKAYMLADGPSINDTSQARGLYNPSVLSARQLQVAQLAAEGLSNREIGSDLHLTEQIVKNALHSVFNKLGVWNRVELANVFLRDQGPPRELSLQIIEAEHLLMPEYVEVLDSKAEGIFDELANIAAIVFGVPIALVAFADPRRVWFKSSIGLDMSEVPRELTICQHTLQQSQVLVVPDTYKDPRFICNPSVQDVGLRFYAAAPILKDGCAFGVIRIVDRDPREFSRSQMTILESLARLATELIDLRQQLFRRAPTASHRSTFSSL